MPRHLEDHLHAHVWQALQMALPETVLIWSVENRHSGPREGARRKRRGCVPGVPDLHFLHDGRLLCVELKTDRGRLSPEQMAFHEHIRDCGGVVEVCRSLEDVLSFLTMHGIKLRAEVMA